MKRWHNFTHDGLLTTEKIVGQRVYFIAYTDREEIYFTFLIGLYKCSYYLTDALNNPNNKVQVILQKLSSNFPVKDKTNPHHQHNIVYHAEFPEPNCSSNYTGQKRNREI